jgi:SpoVK/Ycf46/Vps4 family AAA+-type ATPase
LFAEAVAASFFSPSCFEAIHGPALLDKYIGASERAVRDLFERARSNGRPTLIFFDELEALAPKRGRDTTGVTDRVVNQLLTLLDGVEASMGGGSGACGGIEDGEGDGDGAEVYVLAASSRPDLIDAALLRPGRIERHIYLGLPCQADRVAILHAALRRLRTAADVDQAVDEIALHPDCAQFTSADLGAVVKTAFLAATREGGLVVGDSCGLVTGRLLREAFSATRPSLSARDVAFYDEINGQFAGHVLPSSATGISVGQKQAFI